MSTQKPTYANVAGNNQKKSGAHGGKNKNSKASKHDFERTVKELEKQKKSYQTPKQQKFTFFGVAAWISAAPLYLYGSGIFESNLRENALLFGVSTLITGAILFHMYEVLASQVRHKLLNDKSVESEGNISEEEEKAAVNQSANYSLFIINVLYLALFLLFIAYFLPPYELLHPVAYAVASIFSSLIIATLVSIKLLR